MDLPRPEVPVEGVTLILRSVGGCPLRCLGRLRRRVCGGLFTSRELSDECGVPGPAAIVRIQLLITMSIRRDVRPHSFDKNRFVLEGVLTEEFSATVLERSDRRRVHNSSFTVDERLTPLMRLRVVEKQRRALPMPFRSIGFDLLQLSFAFPDLPYCDRAVKLH